MSLAFPLIYIFITAFQVNKLDTKPVKSLSLQDTLKSCIYLKRIEIKGNKRTHPKIIFRELDILEGDSLPINKLDTIIFRNRNKIFNTDLFTVVDLSFVKDTLTQSLTLNIELQERFYTFPIPIFELADRNLNEWLYERGADLNRTNYGLSFVQKNIFGRNQTLSFLMQLGFVRRLTLGYSIPYIDKKQRLGISFSAGYIQNKSLAYKTENHKLKFLESQEILREKYIFSLSLSYRKGYYDFHLFEAKYESGLIADTVLEMNEKYFLNNQLYQKYFTFRYEYRKDLRDIQAYPLRGHFFRFELEKKGFAFLNDNLDMLSLTGNYSIFRELKKGIFWDMGLEGRLTFLKEQPYANAQGLGYDKSLLRAYELFVIDGQSYLLNKNTLKFRLMDKRKTLKFIPVKQFKTIPIAIYFTTYFDTGYINDRFFTDESNRFSNRLLFGTGVGLDIVTYYNAVISLNYSANVNFETGFFISFNGKF